MNDVPDFGKPMIAKSNIQDMSPMTLPFLSIRSLRGGISTKVVTSSDGTDLRSSTNDIRRCHRSYLSVANVIRIKKQNINRDAVGRRRLVESPFIEHRVDI